jgi:hypothetical protein
MADRFSKKVPLTPLVFATMKGATRSEPLRSLPFTTVTHWISVWMTNIVFPASVSTLLQDISNQVTFETIHPNDPQNELGPLCKVSFSWINDASPECFTIGLFKQGGVYRQHNPGMKLVSAYGISNDGEAFLGAHRDTTLLGFTPGRQRDAS